MTLTPEIIALLMLDALFLFFSLIALVLSVRIFLKWDMHSTHALQYSLEKQSYLVSVVIKYIFTLKIPLFLFFIFTCNKLSNIITGAMCAAGVVNSVDFGLYLTVFKIINLYFFGFWLLLNRADMKEEKLPFTKLKFLLFILFFVPLLAEIVLEISFFSSLNISKIVSCCGTLFSAASTSYLSLLFKVDKTLVVGIFYFFAFLIGIAYFLKNSVVFIFANGMFVIFAIVSLIVFFSTYVYELPTHNCPFCLLQKEYYGVGYVMYVTLYIGTFFGIGGTILNGLLRSDDRLFLKISLLFDTLYVLIVSAYPLSYYLKNGVWL
ncbi:MAG: hypothetical protein PHN18_09360 [Sulfurospirillaceae bacterium]|nr:hypothetical protein [Sulfurospirillaceae bacterium]MDD2827148.1 hypothetical protein [Sulfurospirillaceae bacterium]